MPYRSPKPLHHAPVDITIAYVPADDQFMTAARESSHTHSKGCKNRVGGVLVKEGRIIGSGANCIEQSLRPAFCVRDVLSTTSGQGYDLCANCAGGHCEPATIADAQSRNEETTNATLYMYGHWWCCESCCNAMRAAGIRNVRLIEGATELFSTPQWELPTWPQPVHAHTTIEDAVDPTTAQLLHTALARANINAVPSEHADNSIMFDLALSPSEVALDGVREPYSSVPTLLKYLAARLPQLIRKKLLF